MIGIKVVLLVNKGEGDVTTMTSRQVNHYEKNCLEQYSCMFLAHIM